MVQVGLRGYAPRPDGLLGKKESVKRLFKTQGHFIRYGEGLNAQGYRLASLRSFSTLQAAIRGVRLDVAELEADGVKPPLSLAVRFEHQTKSGKFKDSEIVALWKRGRFVWVDPEFKDAKRNEILSRNSAIQSLPSVPLSADPHGRKRKKGRHVHRSKSFDGHRDARRPHDTKVRRIRD